MAEEVYSEGRSGVMQSRIYFTFPQSTLASWESAPKDLHQNAVLSTRDHFSQAAISLPFPELSCPKLQITLSVSHWRRFSLFVSDGHIFHEIRGNRKTKTHLILCIFLSLSGIYLAYSRKSKK